MQSIKKTPTRSLRKPLIIIGVLVLLIASYTATAYTTKLWPFRTNDQQASQSSSSTAPKSQALTDSKDATTDSTPAPGTTNSAKDTPVDSSTQQTSSNVSIPFAQQKDDMLQITTLITGIESSGTCTLTLTKGSTALTLPSVGIQAGPSSSTCKGFNVSISSQPQLTAGVWNISIAVDSNSTKTSATSTVTIK